MDVLSIIVQNVKVIVLLNLDVTVDSVPAVGRDILINGQMGWEINYFQ